MGTGPPSCHSSLCLNKALLAVVAGSVVLLVSTLLFGAGTLDNITVSARTLVAGDIVTPVRHSSSSGRTWAWGSREDGLSLQYFEHVNCTAAKN